MFTALVLLWSARLDALGPDKSPEDYSIIVWSEEEGLPHRIVPTLFEARDGYIWLGTQGGLARFDGARFTVFDAANTPALTEPSMRSIAETRDGTLWLATLRADMLRLVHGNVERLEGWLPEVWTRGGVRDLFVDSKGTLWLTTGEGIARLGPDGRLVVLSEPVAEPDLNYVRRRIVEDASGRLWIGAADGVREVVGGRVSHAIVTRSVRGLEATRDGALWLGIDGLGLQCFRAGRLTSVPLEPQVLPASFRVPAIRNDRDGNLWVGTSSGLYRVQPERGNAVTRMLPDMEIEDLLEDSNGNLWVATRAGVVMVKDPPFRSIAARRGLQEVVGVVEDGAGTIWFATQQPPFLQRVLGGRAVAFPGPLPGGIQTVFRDRRGRMLLGCSDGVYLLRGSSWERLPRSPRQAVTALAEDASGRLWLGDALGNVHRLAEFRVTTFGRAAGLRGRRVERLYVARDGRVWIATHDGVYYVHEDEVTEVLLGPDPPWRYVRHVTEDAEGALWIGSRGGLTRIQGGRQRSFDARDGLPEPIVHSVVDDLRGNLWVGCSKGIYRVAKADFDRVAEGQARGVEAVLFERRDGIVAGQSWGNAGLRARDGSLWFTTRRGLSTIPSARLLTRGAPPPVFIESAVLNGQARDPRRVVEVEPGEGRLVFEFTALNYDAPHRVLFRYKLEGVDREWRESRGLREAIYAHVAPGRYVFQVTARGPDGVWNNEGATMTFVLRRHWYETWWWYSALALGLLGSAWGVHLSHVRSLRLRERQLTHRVEERTQALQREVAERTTAEEAVRRLADELEQRVSDRTAELAAAKASLEVDVEERKRAEEELSAEKERLAVTLRSIGDGVIATDVHGRIALINRIGEELTGWTQLDAEGRPLAEVFRLVDRWTRLPLADPVEAVIRTGFPGELAGQALLLSRDGRELLIADSAAPIRDRSSRVTGAVLVFRDVTEKRRVEENLASADKLESLGVLAAGIAHDFNNLLMGVFGNIDLARKSCPADSPVAEKLTRAVEALGRARGLSSQLLTFTTGGTPVTAPTDIAALLRDGARFALAGSNVTSDVSTPEDLWLGDLDAGQIAQVIDNLLINARQAMPEGGRIEIRANNVEVAADPILAAGRYVRIAVADHGPGIPADHRSHVFDPFFTTKQEGSGLGLSTARSIVKRHNGHIEFDSVVGRGTTFQVYLPASRGALADRAPAPAAAPPPPGRVLVMDDEEFVRDVARESLELLGLRADVVSDGAAALTTFEAAHRAGDRFDLVILDLTIAGGVGGIETLVRLREIDATVKAIASSGYSSDPVMAGPADFGFQGTLPKPYSIEDLGRVVATLLGRGPAVPGAPAKP